MRNKQQNEGTIENRMEANGRVYVILDGKKFYVDFLVAKTFLINQDPTVYTEVEHIDGNISNNAADNLRWVKNNKVNDKGHENDIDRKN